MPDFIARLRCQLCGLARSRAALDVAANFGSSDVVLAKPDARL
jgi:hypothetical protein